MDRATINAQLTEALKAGGLTPTQYGWQGFDVKTGGSFPRFTVTVSPSYRAKKYGARHRTFIINHDEDPGEKIGLAVQKAGEFVEAERDADRRDREASERSEQRTALMREAAAQHFPDFKYGGSSRDGIFVSREADDCDVFLVVDSKGVVAVREVTFRRYCMSIEEAQRLTAASICPAES